MKNMNLFENLKLLEEALLKSVFNQGLITEHEYIKALEELGKILKKKQQLWLKFKTKFKGKHLLDYCQQIIILDTNDVDMRI